MDSFRKLGPGNQILKIYFSFEQKKLIREILYARYREMMRFSIKIF